MEFRIEHDTMGEVKVPADKYFGAQTMRSLENFKIGREKMPPEIIRAFAILKKGCALANAKLGVLSEDKAKLIATVCDEISAGKLNEHFPLSVWQTGSGTQSNMNFNEVIANRGNEIAGKTILHPNDDVNKSQSSNDTFPAAMHISALIEVEDTLIPAIDVLIKTYERLVLENKDVIKTGRTHLQDATPITLGQELSAHLYSLKSARGHIQNSAKALSSLALGGTAVGTGLNAHPLFGESVAQEISALSGKNFITGENKFHCLTSKDEMVFAHGAIKSLACDLFKIANDIRLLSSGPRCGIGEIFIPENEPGSSIMPGKVNPTQCEALTMVCGQVMANDVAVSFGASQGHFQLNVFMPLISYNFLQSVNLLATAIISFNDNCAVGITPNSAKIAQNLENSLMVVTALNNHIGYENGAKIAKTAYKEGITLKEAAKNLNLVSESDFDKWVRPEQMV